MLPKLSPIESRYAELNRLLIEVGDDYQRAAELNKERIELEPLVAKTAEYRQVLQRLEEARSLLDGEDADLRALALGVARVHAVKVGGEDSRLVPARSGADFHDDFLVVARVFGEQQRLDLFL